MPKRVECPTGTRFGRLTVAIEVEPVRLESGRPMRVLVCVCECGTTKTYWLQNLKAGNTVSCGCRGGSWKHGHTSFTKGDSATYHTWQAMRNRCLNPNHSAYGRYGGAGVDVDPDWAASETGFECFLRDMGERPEGHTLDRINNEVGYFKSNCRWATTQQQYQNKRVVRDSTGKFSTNSPKETPCV